MIAIRNVRRTLYAAVFIVSPALAEPAAIVEEINHDRPDVQFMDMLDQGVVIELAGGQSLVLGYMSSCIRESIHGGTVTIGARQSSVAGGSVERIEVQCDTGNVLSDPGRKKEAAAVVFRRPLKRDGQNEQPRVTSHGLSPLVHIETKATEVSIARLDADEDTIRVPVTGHIADLSTHGVSLSAGGVYRADTGEQSVVFQVSDNARPQAPLLSRLVRF